MEVTKAKKLDYDNKNGEIAGLKDTADKKGMDDNDDHALGGDFTTKTMKKLKDEYAAATQAHADALTLWEATKTEQTRMVATDIINAAWKQAAVAAFNAVDAKYSGDGKQAKLQEGYD